MDGNPGEWAVAFHGVGDPTYFAVPKIAKESVKIGAPIKNRNVICTKTGLAV